MAGRINKRGWRGAGRGNEGAADDEGKRRKRDGKTIDEETAKSSGSKRERFQVYVYAHSARDTVRTKSLANG